jgi:MFS family permease
VRCGVQAASDRIRAGTGPSAVCCATESCGAPGEATIQGMTALRPAMSSALDGGPTELSIVSTAAAAGMLATTLLGGVLADRMPQRRILIAVASGRTVAIGLVALLAVSGWIEVWHLVVVALVIGLANGFTYPAYSALLPSILPPDDLMAANGVEGTLRPTVMQAIGPALASAVIAASSPAAALALVAVLELAGVLLLLAVRPVPLRREPSTNAARPVRAGGGPGDHAVVMAAFGIGGAIGSLGMASLRMPRRYLTVMNLFWGAGCLPLAVVGIATDVRLIAAAVFVLGICFSAPMDLGHAAAASGSAGDARARLQPRLLRLAGVHAGVDGDRGGQDAAG